MRGGVRRRRAGPRPKPPRASSSIARWQSGRSSSYARGERTPSVADLLRNRPPELTDQKPSSEPELSILEAIRGGLFDEMARDERVMVLGMDVGRLGGVFRVTRGLIDEYGPDRVVDTPLAEASLVGASLGLATGGMVPLAELQFLRFPP